MQIPLRYSAFILCLVVLTAADVAAQTPLEAATLNLSPMAGITLDPDARSASTLGLALGYNVTQHLAVEGEVSRLFDMAPDDDDIDAGLTTASANLRYHFGGARITPYVAAGLGVGWYSLEHRVPPANVDATAFGVNLGGGVMYTLNSRARLRGDFRYFNHTHGEDSDPQGLVIVDDVPTTWRIVGALTIRLGG